MEFTVVEQGLSTAEGSLKYDDCQYKEGEKLLGSSGTWQAQLVPDPDTDTAANTETEEKPADADEYTYKD